MKRSLRGEIVELAQELHRRAWVANHDGNLTARLAPDRFLGTPTATSKRRVEDRLLIEVDGKGAVVGGNGKPFGELSQHLAIYQRRPDVGAVIHAHPPYATALAVSGARLLERPFIAEAVVSLGASVPTVPFATPGAAAAAALAPFADDHDAVLCANHGAFAWGADLEQAMLRLELVEHLARVATLAQATGGVTTLPDAAVATLLSARAKAGLGAAADRAGKRPITPGGGRAAVVACAPAPHSDTPTIPPGGARPAPARPEQRDVAALIREELVRALREK
ncbi:MAG TPA: class II aldolase/adducin family protein [Kofleriaceae bacterium]|nr:class II aldolase/adducin family protein [Kofleriaceae bacterium]